MNQDMHFRAIEKDLEYYFSEDDLGRNSYYLNQLPNDPVRCQLKLKSDMVLAGLPWLLGTFKYLGHDIEANLMENEGREFLKRNNTALEFDLPFGVALTGERIALNLLQMASSIATYTKKFVEKSEALGIAILDTRKTLPGHRAIQKYAVRCGGGYNHRLGQNDLWMVKDNHKKFFGGVNEAVAFFNEMQGFYVPVEVEIHDLAELKEAIDLGVRHIMLDNFSKEDIHSALDIKTENMTYEISGGVNLSNIDQYLIAGIDAISIGSLTYGAPPVDISLKYERKS